MAIKKKHPAHENHERWLVSYADFITLLFAFFVVMFASSQADKGKAKQVSEAVSAALENGGLSGAAAAVARVLGGTVDDLGQGNAQMKGPGGAKKEAREMPPDAVVELVPSLKALTADLKDELKAGKLEINLTPRGLVVSLRESAFFPSGTDTIDPKSADTLQKVAKAVNSVPNPIRLEGHTDSVPIHNAEFRSNWELSAARGISMLNNFADHFGVSRSRMAIVGYADTVPVDSNDTAEGRARNRRVDVVFLSQLGLQGSAKQAPAKGAGEEKKPAAEEKKEAKHDEPKH
jgi:chemotaxis protein MotB